MSKSALNPIHVVRAVLALELAPGDPGQAVLSQQAAASLATHIASDLAGFSAPATGLDLVLVGAHYDPVELLRPGWPIHLEMEQLAARAPGEGARVIAFGAHDGQLPGALSPSPDHIGGPLRLLPISLVGDAPIARQVEDRYEQDLIERGMAGAETALVAQSIFGLRIEHARYMTLNDLCAMTALQYEHAGLAPLWPVLETALLAPDEDAWVDAPPEPLLHYAGREARIALFSADGWRRRYAAGLDDPAREDVLYAHFQARQRQYAAVLQAHGVATVFSHCRDRHDPHAELS